jgi:membrane fusion protein, multidrug efflux system
MRPVPKIPVFTSLAALALLAAAPQLGGCESPARAAGPREERAIPVVLSAVRHEPVTRLVRAAGVLRAKRELDLSFKVGGVIQRVAVEEGAHVRRGQLLCLLDPTELEAGSRQAGESLAKAERDMARTRTLHDQNGVPRNMLEDAETALGLARAAEAGASFNLRQGALYAPEDGVIDRRMVEVGEVVAPTRPVLHLTSAGGSVVHVNLVDRDALALKHGDSAQVTLDARPGEPLSARVTRIASSATPGAGTFEVELTLPSARALPSGLTAKVAFERAEPALSVPLTALVDGDGERAALFVVAGERAKRVPVRVLGIEGERALLGAGIDERSKVVATGAAELREGARVRVTGEE